jgi:hypothetical protein
MMIEAITYLRKLKKLNERSLETIKCFLSRFSVFSNNEVV